MTLLLLEGWETELTGYQGGNPRDFGPGRTGVGQSARMNFVNFQVPPAAVSDTICTGIAFKWDGNDGRIFLHLMSNAEGRTIMQLRVRATGQIEVVAGSGGVFGATSLASPIQPNTWHYAEIKAKASTGTTGYIHVRVDRQAAFDATGLRTQYDGSSQLFDGVMVEGFDTWTDDWYVCSLAGATNNDFLGDIVVETLFPNGNGNSSVLVGSDGNSTDNYLLVDEASADTTDFVGSANSGDKDTYAFSNLVHTAGTVVGVQVEMNAAKTDAGARSGRMVARSGGTDYAGADFGLSTSYATYREIREVDPATSAAWSLAAVNAAEFGFEVRP